MTKQNEGYKLTETVFVSSMFDNIKFKYTKLSIEMAQLQMCPMDNGQVQVRKGKICMHNANILNWV